jgi:hypothetical protein
VERDRVDVPVDQQAGRAAQAHDANGIAGLVHVDLVESQVAQPPGHEDDGGLFGTGLARRDGQSAGEGYQPVFVYVVLPG